LSYLLKPLESPDPKCIFDLLFLDWFGESCHCTIWLS